MANLTGLRAAGLHDDRGAVRAMTLTKLVAFLGLVGVFGYDGFAVLSNNVSTEDDAQNAAYAASQSWHNTQNLGAAYQAAVQQVAGKHEAVLTRGFTVDPDGTVHLLLRRSVHTIVFTHIGPLRHLTVTTQHGDANSIN